MDETAYGELEVELATGKVKLLTGGSGTPVVILHHSWGSPGWLPIHTALARSEHSVFVLDMPGWGGSERPAWAREPRDIAIILSRVLERLNLDGVKLVGLGFGGFVAAELATMNPSRLATLVLVGSAGLQPEEGEILDQMMLSHRAYIEASFKDEDAYRNYVGEEPDEAVRELWDLSREMTARVTWKPYMFNRRLAPLLGDMTVPTLVVWGEHDKVVPACCASQFAAAIPNAVSIRMPDVGHVIELEAPNRLASLIAEFPNGR